MSGGNGRPSLRSILLMSWNRALFIAWFREMQRRYFAAPNLNGGLPRWSR